MKKRKQIETSEELVRVFADLFDELAPETIEEADAELRSAGYDPAEVGTRIEAAAKRALAESPLNWRTRAQRELETERARISGRGEPAQRSRTELMAAINQVLQQFGGQLAYAHRNLESETDEDLASLLEQLEYLASQQREPSKE